MIVCTRTTCLYTERFIKNIPPITVVITLHCVRLCVKSLCLSIQMWAESTQSLNSMSLLCLQGWLYEWKLTLVLWSFTEEHYQSAHGYRELSYTSVNLWSPTDTWVFPETIMFVFRVSLLSLWPRRSPAPAEGWLVFTAWRASCFGLLLARIISAVSPHPMEPYSSQGPVTW